MKTDSRSITQQSSLLLLLITCICVRLSFSQIIGSSVVTSVSVVLGNEGKDEILSTTPSIIGDDDEEDETRVVAAAAAAAAAANANNNRIVSNNISNKNSKPEGVLSVIATLKDIVEKEQQKHEEKGKSSSASSISALSNVMKKRPLLSSSSPSSSSSSTKDPTAVQSSSNNNNNEDDDDETPPMSTRQQPQEDEDSTEDDDDDDDLEDDDNDDDDDDEADDDVDVNLTTTSRIPTTTTLAPSSSSLLTKDSDNDTATSAEVNEAIHKISGALLTPGKGGEGGEKPILNIVTDVLSSINDARNSTSTPSSSAMSMSTTNAPPPAKMTTVSILKSSPSLVTAAYTYHTTTSKLPRVKPTMETMTTTSRAMMTSTTTTTNRPRTNIVTIRAPLHPAVPARTGLRTTLRPQNPPSPPSPYGYPPSFEKTEIPEIGKTTSSKLPGLQTDDNLTVESETEEEFFMDDAANKPSPTMMTHHEHEHHHHDENQNNNKSPSNPITKPMKPTLSYSTVKKPNMSSSSNRPTDFYDDEIFGYDPYQTFLHGVYVPVVELGEENGGAGGDGGVTMSESFMMPTTTFRPMDDADQHHSHMQHGFRPPSNNHNHMNHNIKHHNMKAGGSAAHHHDRKPVPNLPDHLHRPRPSHLQYQHGAAEDVDPETGLLAIKRPLSGAQQQQQQQNPHHQPTEEHFAVDRLSFQPRPLLPRPIVENFTNHHNEAHHGGGHGAGAHGHGGGHGGHGGHGAHGAHGHHESTEKRPSFSPAPPGNPGLEATITKADPEMRAFIDINNRLALRLFSSVTNPVSKSAPSYNNMVLSPFSIISSLAMMFLGARSSTAQQLDGLLQLDDMLTFNPHMLYNNVTQSFLSQPNTAAALIRLLIADKSKGDVLEFFRTRVQHFYDARVEEADYKFAGHLAQSIINQMTRAQIQRHSYEMLNYSLPLKGPMSLLTSTFFDGQFSGSKDQSVDSMDFIHLAALGRRLIRVPAVAFKDSLRAAYDKELDATAVEIPYTTRDLSLILLMPGRPGEFAIGGVSSLKTRLTLEAWHSLMRGFYPRDPFKVVFPRFRHQSNLNLTYTMQRMGLTDMFHPSLAKFKGINGLSDLHLDHSMVHFAEFGTWEKLSDTLTENIQQNNKNLDLIRILRPHVREHYGNYGEPMSVNDWIFQSRNPSVTGQQVRVRSNTNPRPRSTSINNSNNYYNYPNVGSSYARVRSSRSHFKDALVSSFNPSRTMSKIYYFRQEPTNNEPETVLRFERPFVYILRHNPTGMILMTGQYTEPVTDVEP